MHVQADHPSASHYGREPEHNSIQVWNACNRKCEWVPLCDIQRLQGPPGPQGCQGPEGKRGKPGERGGFGPKGPRGETGLPGKEGPQGPAGRPGRTGAPGRAGPQGPCGERGKEGPCGKRGDRGPKGFPGDKGPRGPGGCPGPQGCQGEPGISGFLGCSTNTKIVGGQNSTVLNGENNTIDGSNSVVGGVNNTLGGDEIFLWGTDNLVEIGEGPTSLFVHDSEIRLDTAENTHFFGQRFQLEQPTEIRNAFIFNTGSTNDGVFDNTVLDGPGNGFVYFRCDGTGASGVDPGDQNHVYFETISGGGSAGVKLGVGSGSWDMLCDADSKENMKAVDTEQILKGISELDLRRWNYRTQRDGVQHIGPTAQDFHSKFGLNGENNRWVSTVDFCGVGLAGVQALEKRLAAQQEEIEQLKLKLA